MRKAILFILLLAAASALLPEIKRRLRESGLKVQDETAL